MSVKEKPIIESALPNISSTNSFRGSNDAGNRLAVSSGAIALPTLRSSSAGGRSFNNSTTLVADDEEGFRSTGLEANHQGDYSAFNMSGLMNAYRAAGKETAVVVGTSSSAAALSGYNAQSSQSPSNAKSGAVIRQLPEQWMQQRVNPAGASDEYHRTKLQWENQIAKHILSMYATSNAAIKSIKEGSALLDFVETAGTVERVDKKASSAKMKATARSAAVQSIRESDRESELENADTAANVAAVGLGKKRSVVKRKKKLRKRQLKSVSKSQPDTDCGTPPKRESMNSEDAAFRDNYEYVEKMMQKIREQQQQQEKQQKAAVGAASEAKSQQAASKHRITNTVKLKSGAQMVIRGSPRCFPIWFVSTGDVYADWTALPGGAKLQAHLSAIYERRRFHDYLGILETQLVELARTKLYGLEQFALGSFGKTDPVPRCSKLNSRAATAASGKRNGSATAGLDDGGCGDDFGQPIQWEFDDANKDVVDSRSASQKLVRYAPDTTGRTTAAVATAGGSSDTPQHRFRSAHSTTPAAARGETVVLDHVPTASSNNSELTIDELKALWKQLVLTAIAMGILSVEQKQLEMGMTLFKRAEEWARHDDLVNDPRLRRELGAHVKDAMSFYFYKKGRAVAAQGYAEKALQLYEQVHNMDGVGMCLLHVAAVYSSLGNFKESHRIIFQFLAMVESGRLADAQASPRQLCLVAIAYHNLAVVQLKLAMPDLACKNSQNARKIARLCLSYSNRWIDVFQFTHEIAINDIKYELSNKAVHELTKEQIFVVKELAEALFDPFVDP